jgi:hypothetical protein
MINRSCANIILVLLFPFYWVLEGNAQGVWARTYGDLEPQMAYSVIETSDHYYLFAGATDYESWLVKTDILGDTLWTKTFGGKDAYSVIETSDQSYLLAGASDYGPSGMDMTLVKTNSLGDTLWTYNCPMDFHEAAMQVIETSEQNYLMVGRQSSFSRDDAGVMAKTDSEGSLIWTRTFDGADDDGIYSIVEAEDQGYACVGYTYSSGGGGSDFWLIKTDSQGNTQWTQTYGGPNDEFAHSIIKTTDQCYLIAGSTSSFGEGNKDLWLVKTDSLGNELWTRTFGGWKRIEDFH